MTEPTSPSEQNLIQRYFAPLSHPFGLGLQDDAALVQVDAGFELVMTTDTLVENVHFFSHDPIEAIAKKALRVNLSDLAAKGAKPLGILLSLALPAHCDEKWIENFARALGEDMAHFKCGILGGDTVRASVLMISITAVGTLACGQMVKRTGVQAGDKLYVSGEIGDAALALHLIARGGKAHADFENLNKRRLFPEPRLNFLPLMDLVRGCMDVSDGLMGDALALAQTNGLMIDLDPLNVPLSQAAAHMIADDPAALNAALCGGDDYELLMAIAPENEPAFCQKAQQLGLKIANLGTFRHVKPNENLPKPEHYRYSHF